MYSASYCIWLGLPEKWEEETGQVIVAMVAEREPWEPALLVVGVAIKTSILRFILEDQNLKSAIVIAFILH